MMEQADPAGGTGFEARGVAETREALARGARTAREETEARLAAVAAQEPELRAWAHLDPATALAQAEARDADRDAGHPLGPLHGVAIGVKDIVDTADMPTENGAAADAGRRPAADATLVRRLRAAGAVILGKTATTELAYYQPGPTRNPHDPARTPGGSSSGSAAAVGAGAISAAIGTQTNGSVIRPAAFCGVVGFKPSYGRIPRSGVLSTAPSLDQIGVFGRSVDDVAAVAEPLMGPDGVDPQAWGGGGFGLTTTARAAPPVRPSLAFVEGPAWGRAEPATVAAFDRLRADLGGAIGSEDAPQAAAEALGVHRTVMAAEMAARIGVYADRGPEAVSDQLRALVAEGRGVSAEAYLKAREAQTALRAAFAPLFERYDALVTPAAPGEAPVGLETTGDPSFCTIWTLAGLPAISLPLLRGSAGLPLGVQLIGGYGDDARLLRTARWLTHFLGGAG